MYKYLSICAFLLFALQTDLVGQRNIVIDTSTYSIDELVRKVLIQSECADVTNVQFTGKTGQIGYFSSGTDAIDVANGIIISTGRVHDAVGPNQRTGTATDYFDGAHVGDADLRQVANVGVNDTKDDAILEFDFTPLENFIEFEFVFASEEYCDFSGGNSQYNDVFGFFLSGPGIVGAYVNDAKNIAVSPVSEDNITVLNINHNQNYEYFIDNTPKNQPLALPEHYDNCRLDVPRDGISSLLEVDGKSIATLEYDGYTVTLKAKSVVVPLQTYHLKIGIADIIDGTWDSAVFLKAGSFKAGQPKAVIAPTSSLDCQRTSLTLSSIGSSTGGAFAHNWSTSDGRIVGTTSGDEILVDQPGTYRLIVNRMSTTCADTTSIQVVLNEDRPVIQDIISGTITCDEKLVNITIEMDTPDLYTYQIEYPNGLFSPVRASATFTTSHIGLHRAIVTANNGCQEIDTHNVPGDSAVGIYVFEDNYLVTCAEDFIAINPLVDDEGLDLTFEWSTMNGLIVSGGDAAEAILGQGGQYEFTAYNAANGCTFSYSLFVTEDNNYPIISAGPDAQLSCRDQQYIPLAFIQNQSGLEQITWHSLNGGALLLGADPLSPIITSPGMYVLEVENANGCISLDTLIVSPAPDVPTVELIRIDTLDCLVALAIIEIQVTGSYESINWTTIDGDINVVQTDGKTISVSKIGRYKAEVTNGMDCSIDFYVDVLDRGKPIADAGIDRALDCDGKTILEAALSSENGLIEYTWTGGPDPTFLVVSNSAVVVEAGTYQLHVQNLASGCENVDEVIVHPASLEIDYLLEFENCQFEKGEFYIEPNQIQDVHNILYDGTLHAADAHITVSDQPELIIVKADGCDQIVDLNYILNDDLKIEILVPDEVVVGEPFVLESFVNRRASEIASIQWLTNATLDCSSCLDHTITLYETTLFELAVEDIYGCIQHEKIQITPVSFVKVYVPSAFSPNDDGINDKLEIFGNEFVEDVQSVKIYNRWGGLVFSFENEHADPAPREEYAWNGFSNGADATEGIYVYSIILTSTTGVTVPISGNFVLLR